MIYLYTGKDVDNFYQYTPATKVWKKLKDYPAAKRYGAVLNTVNDKLYITGGTNPRPFGSATPDNTLYSYDITRNEWMRMDDYPYFISEDHGNRVHATTLSINNSFIVVGGARTTGNYETMAFNTLTNKWERKADYPPLTWVTSIVQGANGIALKDRFHKYDFNNDTWTELDANLLPYTYSTHTKATFFKHGGYAYCTYSQSSGGARFFRVRLTDLNL